MFDNKISVFFTFLIGIGILICVYLYYLSYSCKKDIEMSMHQDKIQFEFYNEVKDDKDFSEFNFKFKEYERKLCDLVEEGTVKMFLNKNAGSANIAVYFKFTDKKYVFTGINRNMFDQYYKNISWVSLPWSGFEGGNKTNIPVTVEDLAKFIHYTLNKQAKKDFAEFINSAVVKYKINF